MAASGNAELRVFTSTEAKKRTVRYGATLHERAYLLALEKLRDEIKNILGENARKLETYDELQNVTISKMIKTAWSDGYRTAWEEGFSAGFSEGMDKGVME